MRLPILGRLRFKFRLRLRLRLRSLSSTATRGMVSTQNYVSYTKLLSHGRGSDTVLCHIIFSKFHKISEVTQEGSRYNDRSSNLPIIPGFLGIPIGGRDSFFFATAYVKIVEKVAKILEEPISLSVTAFLAAF